MDQQHLRFNKEEHAKSAALETIESKKIRFYCAFTCRDRDPDAAGQWIESHGVFWGAGFV